MTPLKKTGIAKYLQQHLTRNYMHNAIKIICNRVCPHNLNVLLDSYEKKTSIRRNRDKKNWRYSSLDDDESQDLLIQYVHVSGYVVIRWRHYR